MGSFVSVGTEFPFGMVKGSEYESWCLEHNLVNVLNATEFYN